MGATGKIMLLHIAIENYRSIRERATFEMTAGLQRTMRERLAWIKPLYNQRVCPIAGVFGANASGKTTLVRAFTTLRSLLHNPIGLSDGALDYHPFLLDKDSEQSPTRFEVLFSQDETIYEYIVSYTDKKVIFEQLTRLYSATEKIIFTRSESALGIAEFLSEGTNLQEILSVVPESQTLASYLGRLNLERIPALVEHAPMLRSVYEFARKLFVITDEKLQYQTTFSGLFDEWRRLISQVDAGITGVTETEVDPYALGIDPNQYFETDELVTEEGRFRIAFTSDGGKLYKVELEHQNGNTSRSLPWALESEGTKTVVELLAVLSLLSRKDHSMIVVIDELDKSFHTELSRALLDGFLATCDEKTRSQLIFTTHDLLLMDPKRLRRDEMWIVEKDSTGSTHFTSLSEYQDLRIDKDLRRSYLQGRFGGVPNIGAIDFQPTRR